MQQRRGPIVSVLLVAVLLGCTIAAAIVSVPEYAPTLEWSKTYGALFGYERHAFIEATPDGGYIAGGSADPDRDFYVVKTDVAGNTQWNKTWTIVLTEVTEARATCAVATSDGGYAIAGSALNSGDLESAILIKTDSNGVEQWNKTYGTLNYALNLEQTADGGYVLGGGYDTWLAKADTNGILQWNRTYTSGQLCFAHQLEDGGYVAAGFNGSSLWDQSSFFLLKTNPDGDIEWSHAYKHGIVNIAYSASETSDGGYVIAGTTGTRGDLRILVVKTDSQGNILWKQVYGGNEFCQCYCIKQTSDGGYVLMGDRRSRYGTPRSSLMIKIGGDGSIQWSKRSWGEFGGLDIHSLVQSSDEGYVVAGRMYDRLSIAKLTSNVTAKQGPALLFGLLVISTVLESALLTGLIAVEARNMRHQRDGRQTLGKSPASPRLANNITSVGSAED